MKYLILLVLLAACATPYSDKGLMGGYDDLQLADNVFQVRFKGNAYTSREKAADYTLLRSAEIAKQNGFNYFVITDKDSWAKLSTYKEPTESKTTGTVTVTSANTANYEETTTTKTNKLFFKKPRAENTIVCFTEKPKSLGAYYDTDLVITQIKTKYKIN